MTIVYIDMDGVVANYNKSWKDLMDPTDKWDEAGIAKFITLEGFNDNMEMLPGVNKLRDYIGNSTVAYTFLSSCGAAAPYYANLMFQQKRAFLNKIGFADIPLICTFHKGLKKHFANPQTILLDDTKQNIYDWIERGGCGIHVKSYCIDDSVIDALDCAISTAFTEGVYYGQ